MDTSIKLSASTSIKLSASDSMKLSTGDLIIVEDAVDAQCVRHAHLMSNSVLMDLLPGWGLGTARLEAGVWHWRSEYPYRGVLDVQCQHWKRFRRLVVWSAEGCASMREAISQAEFYFAAMFGFMPKFVFAKRLPVEHGTEFNNMFLLEAEWMLERCVAVGGRR